MKTRRNLRGDSHHYRRLIGIGGIGSGIFFALDENHTLGREESRLGRLLAIRDYCKLHIISHYVARLLGAGLGGAFRVIPIGKVGDDAPGRQMMAEMSAAGMDTNHVEVVAGSPTMFSVCFQYPDGMGGNITASNSAAAQLDCDDLDKAEHLFAEPSVALAAPEVPLETRAHFLRLAGKQGAFRAASFTAAEVAPARELGMFSNLELVSLNEGEAAALAGCPFQPSQPVPFLRACEQVLRTSLPKLRLVVTAGRLGAFAYSEGIWDFCPAPRVNVASTAGAGDALLGGLIVGEVCGIPFIRRDHSLDRGSIGTVASALDFAVLLASYTATSPHTIHPQASKEALLAFASQIGVELAPKIHRLLGAHTQTSSATRP
ncbi:MAG TPA: PfkB family carbohydrate kinase [Terriglobales bacterium]|nr:PfkB family carbohydrate kinase [Terriglobales bacterium]